MNNSFWNLQRGFWRSLYSLNSDRLIEAADAKELRTWLASIQVWPSSPLSSKDPAVGGFCLSSLKFIPAHTQPYLDELCWTCVVECKVREYWLRIGVIALQCRPSSRSLTKMQMPTPWYSVRWIECRVDWSRLRTFSLRMLELLVLEAFRQCLCVSATATKTFSTFLNYANACDILWAFPFSKLALPWLSSITCTPTHWRIEMIWTVPVAKNATLHHLPHKRSFAHSSDCSADAALQKIELK